VSLGKVMNPTTGKAEVNLELARDSIDTLLMLKEKTKGNLTETEKGLLENSMQDLELNYVEVAKNEVTKQSVEEKTNKIKEKEAEKEPAKDDNKNNKDSVKKHKE
jgi:hypothetical protein